MLNPLKKGERGNENPLKGSLSLPSRDLSAIGKVAKEYNLNPNETNLLIAIRKAENGGPGREFGVLTPEAMRYKDNPELSLITQARWAAGTIKKRYTGDLESFASRWAPVDATNDPQGLNKNWLKNVKYHLENS